MSDIREATLRTLGELIEATLETPLGSEATLTFTRTADTIHVLLEGPFKVDAHIKARSGRLAADILEAFKTALTDHRRRAEVQAAPVARVLEGERKT